jgi:hypothetical protein
MAMKIDTYAGTVKVGETVWIAPKGKRTPVRVTVTEVKADDSEGPFFDDWVVISGNRQTAKGTVLVTSVSMPPFAVVKWEM